MKHGLLRDKRDGSVSSKRIAGFVGLIMIGYALYTRQHDALMPLCLFTAGCFGFTVLEKEGSNES